MNLINEIHQKIQQIIKNLKQDQYNDGSWRYCFENGPTTDANMIILLRVLDYDDENLIKKLVARLLQQQQNNGAWKLYDDEKGNLSATIEAYTALLFSGHLNKDDPLMKLSEQFIVENGGLEKSHISTKCLLAITNLYPWPRLFPIPLSIMNIPKFLTFNFFHFSSYVQAHFLPMLILGHDKFVVTNKWTPDLQHLFLSQKKYKALKKKKRGFNLFKKILPTYKESTRLKAEQHIYNCIEKDGTLYSYASSTFFMIYALLSLGYTKSSPIIKNAIGGIRSFLYEKGDVFHIQNSPSTVWDTALISYSLQESGLTIKDPAIQLASNFLMELQHKHSNKGWGFSESNSINPDVDDTQAALRALSNFTCSHSDFRMAWNSGVDWLLTMQNNDGGWGAFKKNSPSYIKWLFPIQSFEDTAIDPSAADITGRTLEFLGNHLNLTMQHPRVMNSVKWLIKNQTNDGSWYGRWGISYIYGTWAAVTGLKAVGVSSDHPTIQKATDWLLNIRQSDGGWGESCQSDFHKEYIPLSYSTLVQTCWAVDALISISEFPTKEITEGIIRILEWQNTETSRTTYPTGAGLPGHFYIHYHSYQYVWPLVTLSHYLKKYN